MTEPTTNTGKHIDPPSRIPWPPILLLCAIAASIMLDRHYPLTWPGMNDLPARAVGLTIGTLGVVLAIWSAWTLHRAKTTIMPHGKAENLVTSGPYVRFRNPIYLADIMMLLGAAELTNNIWFVICAAIFGVLVTILAILPEERHLEARFGDAYRNYKARSRRWL